MSQKQRQTQRSQAWPQQEPQFLAHYSEQEDLAQQNEVAKIAIKMQSICRNCKMQQVRAPTELIPTMLTNPLMMRPLTATK